MACSAWLKSQRREAGHGGVTTPHAQREASRQSREGAEVRERVEVSGFERGDKDEKDKRMRGGMVTVLG